QLFYTCFFSTLIGLVFFRKREKEVDKQMESLEIFGRAVAHEVRNVIAISKSYASSISLFFRQFKVEKVVSSEDDNGKTALIKVNNETYKLLDGAINGMVRDNERGIVIINRMLASMRRQIKTDEFALYSMRECVEGALASYGLRGEQQDRILLNLEDDFMFRGSDYYMHHIIFNLLRNTYKYSHDDCAIEISLDSEKRRLLYKDHGPGIAPKARPYIFDHFFTTSKTGSGIGLAFCRLVMDEFGGMIMCKSEQGPNSYTEFWLDFPDPDNLAIPKG
ncbi:MAG: sensor histidine kinase, partial [Bacteroidota bacterium]